MPTKSKLPPINTTSYGIKGGHCHKITKKELAEKTALYQKEVDKTNETKSCFLFLDDIKYLLEYYSDPRKLNGENPIDGFRIYFFREDENRQYSYPGQKILKVGDKTQMSIIVVPVNNYQYPKEEGTSVFQAENMFNTDDECLVLTPGGEHTGLCPTNCPK